MDPVMANWTDLRSEDDVDAFTVRSAERRQLFEDIRATGRDTALAPVTWAFLQIANLESIRHLAQPGGLSYPLRCLTGKIADVVRLWRQRKESAMTAGNASPAQPPRTTPSSQPSSKSRRPSASPDSAPRTRSKRKFGQQEYSLDRSPTVAKACKLRDGNLCAVSRMGEIDAAHIYPWCAFGQGGTNRVVCFWEVLRMFWPYERVQAWRDKIFVDPNTPNRGTEAIYNMISLTATLHRFHSAGAFALRPIRMSADKSQLELEFHWLFREVRSPDDKVDLMVEPSSSRDRALSGVGYGPFSRTLDTTIGTSEPLVSGTRFTMSTDDPVEKPLPDPDLLTLQWHLQRVLAMSGAAGWKEEEFGDDDDDDAPGQAIEADVEHWPEDLSAHHQQHQNSPGSDAGDSEDGSFE